MASQNFCFEMPISLVKICVYVAKKKKKKTPVHILEGQEGTKWFLNFSS